MRRRAFLLRIFLGLLVGSAGRAPAGEITVSAAVSLKEAITQVGDAYEKSGGDKVDFNFGSSGQLLAQIRQGAPVDVFISAADKQMDDAVREGLAAAETRRVVAANTLVLIVPAAAKTDLRGFEQLTEPSIKRLAIGQPKTVPAGEYAADVLDHLKLSAKLDGRIVYGASVRQVLDYVERGEVDAGIVYRTDAMLSADKVRVIAEADASWHRPIRYPAAVTSASKKKQPAGKFLDFLATDAVRSILKSRGFAPPPPKTTSTSANPSATKP